MRQFYILKPKATTAAGHKNTPCYDLRLVALRRYLPDARAFAKRPVWRGRSARIACLESRKCVRSIGAWRRTAGRKSVATNPPGRSMKVGLFVTCLVDLMRPSIGFAAL